MKLNDSRKALQELFDVESDEDEKKSQKVILDALKRRRLTIAGIMSTVAIESPKIDE